MTLTDFTQLKKSQQCNEMHSTELSTENGGLYANGWKCDSCPRLGSPAEARYHCHLCTYDLCVACQDKPLVSYKVWKKIAKINPSSLQSF